MTVGAAVVAVSFALAGIALFGGGGDSAGPAATATTAAPTTRTGAPSTTLAAPAADPPTATARPMAVGRTYAVGTRALTFVDASRATSPNGSFAGAPSRTLPTQVWYPAEGAAGARRSPTPRPTGVTVRTRWCSSPTATT